MSDQVVPPCPADAGFYWPAEWEPHAATWLAWPHNQETWPGKFAPVPDAFERWIRVLAEHEPVHVLSGPDALGVEKRFKSLSNVHVHAVLTNDAWIRDYGPLFLKHRQQRTTALVDWQYDAWGGKYPPYTADNQANAWISRQLGLPTYRVPIVLEGGSIEGDGCGTVMTTESCVLRRARAAGLGRDDMEHYLQQFACAERVLWLPGGDFAGDDTDGHIDQLARFANPQTILVASAEEGDANYRTLVTNRRYLEQARNSQGRPYELVDLPIPAPIMHEGVRLPASYCNYYLANGVLTFPRFDDQADDVARGVLAELFPDRRLVPIDCRDIIWGLGALHCLSQQQPKADDASQL